MMKKLIFAIACLISLTASAQEQFSVFFDSNKHELKKAEQDRLNTWIGQNQTSKILAINGYTDEDGSIGLNDTLAQRRVNHIFNLVKAKVKAREDFKTRSFGKLHKHSPVKAENRKVVIYYLPEKELHRENEVLGIKPEPKPATAEKVIPPASYSLYMSAKDKGGLRSGKAGRTEIKEEATFFKDVSDSLPKEIQAARSNGDRSTADALSMLQTIISRQEAAKLGDRRTNAGRILMTQKEIDDVLDALMVSLDRQVELNSEKRQVMFAKLIDMMAKAAMGTVIDKTTEELQGRTITRRSASGRTVNIQDL